jgi:hypothetical protein
MDRLRDALNKTRLNFKNMCGLSRRILLIGETVLMAYMTGFFIYILNGIETSTSLELSQIFETSKLAIDNIAAGLCVLWGGALMIDYLFKTEYREK